MIWGRRASKDPADQPPEQFRAFVTDEGLAFGPAVTGTPSAAAATALLDQLVDEGLAEHESDGHLIRWPQLYVMLDDQDAARELIILGIPATIGATPKLVSRGSLTDESFAITIDGWVDADRRALAGARLNQGALEVDGTPHLIAPLVWDLVERVRNFARRGADARDDAAQRQSWGNIRQSALAAGAMLDDFLYRTVVLTPDKLQLTLRRSGDHRVVEVEPWFEGAPTHWLNAFDRSATVRERYDLTTTEGVIQVMIAPEVGTVLREIKRMPGRRLTGERAEAFLLNPTAAIGPDAAHVIDAEQFEAAKEQAGIAFDRFAAMTPETHGPDTLGLLITSGTGDTLETRVLTLGEEDVREFTGLILSHLDRNLQLCSWDDYEFELDGDSRLHCEALLRALGRRSEGLITYGAIYDLSGYSGRIQGIGQDKAFYSPHVAKRKEGDGWFPENLVQMIGWTDPLSEDPVVMPLTDELSEELRTGVEIARERGSNTVPLTGCPSDIPLAEAEAILSAFANVRKDASNGALEPPTFARRGKRPTLILKGNIVQIDYREERLAALVAPPASARLPSGLRPEIELKEHQLEGLAWMQHLLALAPDQCRGALLADDMGLGKTLQILCLISRAREEDPAMPPALVVAPLSLLENWREEADKFLEADSLRILTAYGDRLGELRVDRSAVDEQLRREGLVRFLKPDWRGDADVVLTTYETLRDLEFSFARERWSVMVCDEAQKIKNPNAAMTKAAKKQQAAFRIACTGTPVENSLVDLWCLFDFVQPGLLGALNEFASSYRRPIEAEGEDDRAKIEELRRIIAPQLLRRMKAEVATDLKDKIVDGPSRSLQMSAFQRSLYVGAIEGFRKQAAASAGHLALLHRLRLLCSEPSGDGEIETFDPIGSYRARSPKLDWLIKELESIRDRQEKAIVFCEFKAIQRLIRHYVRDAFGITPDIINGDTSAVASSIDSRQKRIRKFQEQPGFGVIVLSPVAVGFGVNMQAANHVIHFTRTWNPAKEDQATDRAYRIGQERDVFVYYPTVSAEDFKTFDVKLDELLERKRSLAGDMLNGTGDIGLQDFDMEELQPTPPRG